MPDDDETLVSWYDGGPQLKSPHGYTGADNAAFERAADGIVADNGTARIPDEEDELILNAQTVELNGQTGALIVVTYYGDARAGLRETIRTYVVVALLALLAITAFAAAQSGRLLRAAADPARDRRRDHRLRPVRSGCPRPATTTSPR